jgi:RecB family exonuclease
MTASQSEAVASRAGAWHQSTLSTIHDCPRRWFLTYLCGLPDPSGDAALAGTAVHAAIEHFETVRRDGGPLPTMDDLVDLACSTITTDLHPMASAAVRHWWKAPMKDGGDPHRLWLARMEPVLLEPYFRVELVDGAMPVGGWMDAVYRTDSGRYQIVDLKTTGSWSRWGSGDGHRHQATMYAVALQLTDLLPDPPDYLAPMMYTIAKTKTGGEQARRVAVEPDLTDVGVLGQRIRDAEAAVAAGEFPRNPASHLCSVTWCPHWQGCMVTGELAGAPAAVRLRLP